MLILFEKKEKSFSKKGWEPLNFVKKMGQKSHGRLFLLSFSSKLSHFNKNLNFNHKLMPFTNLEKTDMVFICNEAHDIQS
jgi:hypothetical protein